MYQCSCIRKPECLVTPHATWLLFSTLVNNVFMRNCCACADHNQYLFNLQYSFIHLERHGTQPLISPDTAGCVSGNEAGCFIVYVVIPWFVLQEFYHHVSLWSEYLSPGIPYLVVYMLLFSVSAFFLVSLKMCFRVVSQTYVSLIIVWGFNIKCFAFICIIFWCVI